MSLKPWKVLESTYLHPRFRIDKCELPNGKILDATILEFRSWGNVLAITKDGKAVLVKQYRHGIKEILLEIPGGVIEDGENPSEGIKRELLEETGYSASNFIEVGRMYPNPALQTNTQYCFLAFNAELADVQHLDDGEDIEVHLVPLDELIAMTKNGGFPHALDIAVLFHALAYMDRIK